MWTLNQVEVIPIVVGALGTVSKRLEGKDWDCNTS